MEKNVRSGIYALAEYKGKILAIKKKRGPYKGFYDLPGGKIDYWEKYLNAFKRELLEETGMNENDYEIIKLFSVEEDFIEKNKDHILALVYLIKIKNLNLDYVEKGGDSSGLTLIDIGDRTLPKTYILSKVLGKF